MSKHPLQQFIEQAGFTCEPFDFAGTLCIRVRVKTIGEFVEQLVSEALAYGFNVDNNAESDMLTQLGLLKLTADNIGAFVFFPGLHYAQE